jgi:hypothetical protein
LTVAERVYPTSLYFYILFAALPSCKHITGKSGLTFDHIHILKSIAGGDMEK